MNVQKAPQVKGISVLLRLPEHLCRHFNEISTGVRSLAKVKNTGDYNVAKTLRTSIHEDWSPIHLRLIGQSSFKPYLRPGYFLLWL